MRPSFSVAILFTLVACSNKPDRIVEIPFYEKGIIYNKKVKAWGDKVHGKGTYHLKPHQEMVTFDFSTKEFLTDTLLSMTKEVKPINFVILYEYDIKEDQLVDLAKTHGPNFHEKFVKPFVQNAYEMITGAIPYEDFRDPNLVPLMDIYMNWINRNPKFNRFFWFKGMKFEFISNNPNPGYYPYDIK